MPVGPVGTYLVALTARSSLRIEAFAALGVASADGVYAAMAAVAGTALAPLLVRIVGPLRWASVVVLIGIAVMGALKAVRRYRAQRLAAGRLLTGHVGKLATALASAVLVVVLAVKLVASRTGRMDSVTNAEVEVQREGTRIAVTDRGGDGPPVVLLHGLAGSSCELLPTADALTDRFRVLLVDQRGHGRSTRRPADVSRSAYVGDAVAVIEQLVPGQRVRLVGQSMGAHTAFLTSAARPDLIDRLVMLEGHVAADDDPEGPAKIGQYFASWPVPFADQAAARSFLGESPLTDAWVNDLEAAPDGLRPRFDPDIMQATIAAVQADRWTEWENLTVPTLAVFAEHGMFTAEQKDELIRRRPGTRRADLSAASHDAHLDAFEAWIGILRGYLSEEIR
jgi:pimeloyl-ACP methyl ester carboxylesterase